MTDADFLQRSVDQPLSMASTWWVAGKEQALKNFGLGTVLREAQVPDINPSALSPEDQRVFETRGSLNPIAGARGVLESLGVMEPEPDTRPVLTESEYQDSPYFRDGVPWQKGMTDDRAAALADQYDASKVREFYSAKRPVTAVLGGLAGVFTDPINYIPILGEEVAAANIARFGRIVGRALTSSADAAANTSIASIATIPERETLGDDVSWQSTLSQIGMAALVGGAFGAIHGRFGREVDPALRADAEQKLATLENVQKSRVALNDAIDGMMREGEVNLSPASAGFASDAASEAARIARAWDTVHVDPNGPVRDPLVHITPEDIEGTIVARGAFKDINEVEFSKRGWGLVKIIWGHGDQSREAPEFQVTKNDVVALPQVIREYEPSSVSADGLRREWRVNREGRTIVYADTMMPEGRHLVTTYVAQTPGEMNIGRSKKRPVAAGSSSDVGSAIRDTERGLNSQRTAGQPPASGSRPQAGNLVGDTVGDRSIGTPEAGSLPASRNVRQAPAVDNSTPARADDPSAADAAKRVGKPDDVRALAQQYRIDPATGHFPEMDDIEQMRAEGRLTEEDQALLNAATEVETEAKGYGEALKAFARCAL